LALAAGELLYDIATRSTDPNDRLERFLAARTALQIAFDGGGSARTDAGRLLARTCLQIALFYEGDSARSSLYLSEGIRYAEEIGDRELANELRSRL